MRFKIMIYSYFLLSIIMLLYAANAFSQTKVVDGNDDDGREYVEKLIGYVYPSDKAEMDTLFETITKYSLLADARKTTIDKLVLKDNNSQMTIDAIYIEVSGKDKATTQDFIDILKTLKEKIALKWHRCKDSELTGNNDYPCEEKPLDKFEKEKQ